MRGFYYAGLRVLSVKPNSYWILSVCPSVHPSVPCLPQLKQESSRKPKIAYIMCGFDNDGHKP